MFMVAGRQVMYDEGLQQMMVLVVRRNESQWSGGCEVHVVVLKNGRQSVKGVGLLWVCQVALALKQMFLHVQTSNVFIICSEHKLISEYSRNIFLRSENDTSVTVCEL